MFNSGGGHLIRHDEGMTATASDLFTTHEELLTGALRAITERAYWSAYPESPSPKVYGETAAADGKAAFTALLGADFPLDQAADGWIAPERSPFGIALDVRYP